MSPKYPVEKIEQLIIHMNNFNTDITEMKQICDKITEWKSRGLNINSAIQPLNDQIDSWEETMETLIGNFKQNILKLKELDDRIDQDESTQITDQESLTYTEKWSYLYPIYQKIFSNLENDIEQLTKVEDIIANYESLGIKLGDAQITIQEQNNNILTGITNSLTDLQLLINTIQEESKKILSEDEATNSAQQNENYLAVYSKLGFDANSFLLYFNMNTQINWDATIDGTNILKHVKKALFSTHSPIYDEEIGNAHYETGSTDLYQYFYYGFNKNEMIQGKILNESYGASYQDEHGYQRIINCLYDKSIDHVQELVNLFSSNNLTYNPGSQSSENLYIVYSIEEINDFSNIVFRGEDLGV